MSNGVKRFAKIKGSDDNKLAGGEEVDVGMQNGDESSCS